jgi:hypothetical protein
MAVLVAVALITALIGVVIGAFLRISLAIRRDDHALGSLRSDAPNHTTRAARSLVGFTSSRQN